jgi:RNA polymerase sigma factor (sigma-70 family)
MTDQKIIQLLRTKETDRALGVLYKHFPMMKKMILANGGTSEDAEDIFQEALVIFCRKAKDYDFELTSQLSTYLYGICYYLWKDEKRRAGKIVTTEVNAEWIKADESGINKLIDEDNRVKLAEKVLDGLGERCRELLLLFYNGGIRLKDIARKMGYNSEGSAKNQKYKCLEAAKLKLKELKTINATI